MNYVPAIISEILARDNYRNNGTCGEFTSDLRMFENVMPSCM